MTDAALRLALVLPLLLLGLGGVLVAARRGLIRLPGASVGAPPLRLVQVVALGPASKLAVAEFGGAMLLLGVGRDGVRLLSSPSTPREAERGEGRGGVSLPRGPRLARRHPTTLPSLGSQGLTGRGGSRK